MSQLSPPEVEPESLEIYPRIQVIYWGCNTHTQSQKTYPETKGFQNKFDWTFGFIASVCNMLTSCLKCAYVQSSIPRECSIILQFLWRFYDLDRPSPSLLSLLSPLRPSFHSESFGMIGPLFMTGANLEHARDFSMPNPSRCSPRYDLSPCNQWDSPLDLVFNSESFGMIGPLILTGANLEHARVHAQPFQM